jgi:hypothetical protein
MSILHDLSGRIGSADSSMNIAWSRDVDEVFGTDRVMSQGHEPVTAEEVAKAAAEAASALTEARDRDWDILAGDLGWTCFERFSSQSQGFPM